MSTKLPWDVWNEVPHPDGMAIYDPDGFRGGRPTVVTWDEFERGRMECTLLPRPEFEARVHPHRDDAFLGRILESANRTTGGRTPGKESWGWCCYCPTCAIARGGA